MDRVLTLNLIITGQSRCGASVLQTALDRCAAVACHAELLHPSERTRKQFHENYFGPSPEGVDLHFKPEDLSAEQYLNERVFDRPGHGETVVGVKLPYPHLERWKLWEYLHDRCQDGDFATLHLRRNPLACYVSAKQAEQTGVWYQFLGDELDYQPDPIDIDPKEFTDFCREHLAHEARLRQMVDDRLDIEYQELFLNYDFVMRGVFAYLGVGGCCGQTGPHLPCDRVRPAVRRLRNRNIRDRVLNFTSARARVPRDVRLYFDSPDLF